MINEKQNIVNDLFNRTNNLLNLLKSQASQKEIYFLPVGILLLKWINDSKERFNWKTTFSYKDIINICEHIHYNGKGTNEIYSIVESIEEQNPMLDGIFTDLCFSSLNYVEPEYITNIIMDYSTFEFNDIDSEKDITGPFIELFLQKLSDDLSSYSFITPKSIKELLANLFNISENMNIADITCGTGGILSQIINGCNSKNLDVNTINLYGQEINFKIALIGKVNLLLHGMKNSSIVIKDSLREPILNDNQYINNVDIILSNLPLGLKWNINEIGYKNDFKYDIPSTMNADWLFIQRGLSALNNCGRAAFIVSKGTLTRKTEMKIREYILKDDFVEAIISLPSNLYGSKTIPIEILIINKNKDITLKNKVLFIDASKAFYKKERGKNDLKPEHIDKLLAVYHNYTEIDGYSKLVDISMIEKHNFELDSSIYINNSLTDLKNAKMQILSKVADIKRGLQMSKNDIQNNKSSDDNSYYYIKISDLNDGKIQFNDKIKNLSASKINSYELKPNDILISARGTLIKLAIYEEHMQPSVFSGNILLIRVKQNYNPYFLKFYLSSPKGRELISSMQGGSTIISLNPNKLKEMLVPDISLEEQNELAERIKSNEKNYKQRILQAKNIYDQNLKTIDEEINYYINC
ncbi:N-6 DNA methylase [Clostridium botulinum]|uniref:N-6 DNA methylase n=1 Tax=Clostridium botulinum TaxID=1491 RepID=UPI000772DBC6|nr:N-6 DNA methylase [Clostridium botulinum]MBY6932182.1 N-6 DNA methylase [Clostridium botulinum]